jgi:hypothetical protein
LLAPLNQGAPRTSTFLPMKIDLLKRCSPVMPPLQPPRGAAQHADKEVLLGREATV